MPTKPNRAGKQQNYVPKGNGDASGEYGDNATGSNKHIQFTTFKKPKNQTKVREKKKIRFRYNNVYKQWFPMTDKEWEQWQKQKENAEKYGYYGYRDEKIEEKELNVLDEQDTNQAKEDIYKQVEKDIDNATIDNIKDFVGLSYYMTPKVTESIENSLSKNYELNQQEAAYFIKSNTLFTDEQKKQLSEKADKKALELADTYIKDNFKKIKGEHTIEQDLKSVNPKYGENRYYGINCQRCSFAYELRRRGYDVEAYPNKNDFGWGSMWKTQMQFKEQYVFKNRQLGSRGVANKIIEKVKNAGEGSRWAVDVQWARSTSGHLFIAENVGGEVKFFDAQTGNQDCMRYFNNIATTKETFIYRMDNADFNYGVKETGFSPKGE